MEINRELNKCDISNNEKRGEIGSSNKVRVDDPYVDTLQKSPPQFESNSEARATQVSKPRAPHVESAVELLSDLLVKKSAKKAKGALH